MVVAFKSDYDFYVNLDTLKIIDEYDYINLFDEQKSYCILIPKYTYSQYVKTAKKFLLKKEYKKFYSILSEYIEKEFELEKINGLAIIDEQKVYMSSFHTMCEDYDIWSDFLDYEYKELERKAIIWCKNKKLKFEVVERNLISNNFADEFEKTVDLILNDEKRNNYYFNKYFKEQ